MENNIKRQAMDNTDNNLTMPLEALFACAMAGASIYAAWCTVSLLFRVVF